MANETADDPKGATPEGQVHGPQAAADEIPPSAPAPTPADKPGPAKAADRATDKPAHALANDASEWTASDSRGPLECADDSVPGAADRTDRDVQATREQAGASALPTTGAVRSTSDQVRDEGDSDARPQEPVRRSVLPIAASLIIGALVGAGSAAAVYQLYGPGAAAGGGSQLDALQARVDALETRKPSADVVGLEKSVADLETRVAALQKGGATGAGQATDLGPIEQKIATLQSAVEAVKAGGGQDVQQKLAALQAGVDAAKKESAATQAGLAGVEGQQKLLIGKAMAPAVAVVADSLVQQIDHGKPYVAQVDALASLGVDPAKVAVLRQSAESGVPSAKTLAAKFEPLAEPIVATAHRAPANAGFVDKLKSGMYGLVSVRSVDDTSGTDVPSRVARIKADLSHDDVADALATWEALPPDAKTKGGAWAAAAKSHAEAMSAARSLQQDAILALGAKKS